VNLPILVSQSRSAAVESGDEATITMLSNIYEIKREESNAS